MIKYTISIIVCVFTTWISTAINQNDESINNLFLSDLEEQLGKDFSNKKPNLSLQGVSVKAGESIVKNGFVPKSLGKKSGQQSKHFVCTSCHNVEREDPNLSILDPQARLDYVSSKGLPFLQGSPLYGVINRSTYYNGDYYKKYGELVFKAQNNIREAIQLCAQECAQGRKLADWEVESILAYFWTIGIKMNDLEISDVE
ncbi:MAG TPA: hypothetical protein PKD85_20205, partial [Saprospiraceae bacterium]|nr:hypothetical protein [Saprospiraceae bacterium]